MVSEERRAGAQFKDILHTGWPFHPLQGTPGSYGIQSENLCSKFHCLDFQHLRLGKKIWSFELKCFETGQRFGTLLCYFSTQCVGLHRLRMNRAPCFTGNDQEDTKLPIGLKSTSGKCLLSRWDGQCFPSVSGGSQSMTDGLSPSPLDPEGEQPWRS